MTGVETGKTSTVPFKFSPTNGLTNSQIRAERFGRAYLFGLPPNDDEQKTASFRANAAMETAMSQETSLPTGSAPLRSTFKWHTAERGSLDRPDTFHVRS